MGKASSAKKIKRVQQAGVSRAPGQRRNMAYPALIIGIIVVGTVLVWFARESRVSTAEVAPTSSDTWYSPFGTNICGEFQGNFPAKGENTTGITTNGNGLIRINPKGTANEGAGATFGKFLASVGMTVADGTLTLPDGTTKRDGEQCGNEAGRVALYVWPPQANDKSKPRVITQAAQINAARFVEDGQIFVIAFTPRDSTAKLPPSVAQLDDPTGNPSKESPSTTTTTEAGSTTSTTAGAGG